MCAGSTKVERDLEWRPADLPVKDQAWDTATAGDMTLTSLQGVKILKS